MGNVFFESALDRYVEECGCVRFDSRDKAKLFVSRMFSPLDWHVHRSGSFYYVVRADRFKEILARVEKEVSFCAASD